MSAGMSGRKLSNGLDPSISAISLERKRLKSYTKQKNPHQISAGKIFSYFVNKVIPITANNTAQANRKITVPFSPNRFLIPWIFFMFHICSGLVLAI
jgi:hypothetical protein